MYLVRCGTAVDGFKNGLHTYYAAFGMCLKSGVNKEIFTSNLHRLTRFLTPTAITQEVGENSINKNNRKPAYLDYLALTCIGSMVPRCSEP